MSGQYSVQNTKEVLRLGLACFQAYENITEDGKIGLEDLSHVVAVTPYIKDAVSDVSLVPKELGEVDAADAKELRDYAAQILGEMVDSDLVEIVNAVLSTVVSGLETFALIRAKLHAPKPE